MREECVCEGDKRREVGGHLLLELLEVHRRRIGPVVLALNTGIEEHGIDTGELLQNAEVVSLEVVVGC